MKFLFVVLTFAIVSPILSQEPVLQAGSQFPEIIISRISNAPVKNFI